jgi:hypothetical protein
MNQSGSHLNFENFINTGYLEGSPPQGLGMARRGKVGFRENCKLRPPRECPRGGGGNYRNGGRGRIGRHHISSCVIFMGNLV